MIEGEPDGCCITRTVAVLTCGLTQRQNFVAGQMLARTALFVGDAHRPEAHCSILSVWGCCLDQPQHGGLPRLRHPVCSITSEDGPFMTTAPGLAQFNNLHEHYKACRSGCPK